MAEVSTYVGRRTASLDRRRRGQRPLRFRRSDRLMIAETTGSFRIRSVPPGQRWQPDTNHTSRLTRRGNRSTHLPGGYADYRTSCQCRDARPGSGSGGRERVPLVRPVPAPARSGAQRTLGKPAHPLFGPAGTSSPCTTSFGAPAYACTEAPPLTSSAGHGQHPSRHAGVGGTVHRHNLLVARCGPGLTRECHNPRCPRPKPRRGRGRAGVRGVHTHLVAAARSRVRSWATSHWFASRHGRGRRRREGPPMEAGITGGRHRPLHSYLSTKSRNPSPQSARGRVTPHGPGRASASAHGRLDRLSRGREAGPRRPVRTGLGEAFGGRRQGWLEPLSSGQLSQPFVGTEGLTSGGGASTPKRPAPMRAGSSRRVCRDGKSPVRRPPAGQPWYGRE